MKRVMLCVDGSVGGMAAARLAMRLALEGAGEVLAVCATDGGEVAEAIDALAGRRPSGPPPGEPAAHRLERAAGAMLARVEELARAAEVPMTAVLRQGRPLEVILGEAMRWEPDVVVIGRTGRRGPASTVLGSVTAQVLEFSDWPVVVVPARAEPEDG